MSANRHTLGEARSFSSTSLKQSWIALVGLSAVFLFEMLDNSILNVALPTIGRELNSSTVALQWVTGAYGVVFGGLMLMFGAVADRFGRRRIMLIGLVLLGVASLATAFVTSAGQLIVVRAVMGAAAAMTTPGSMALAFRLFDDDAVRVRAITLISTVGVVGLAIGPTAGGFILAIAPWQVLLLVNVPIALLAFIGIRAGIAADDKADLHHDKVDVLGAFFGTATIVFTLVAPSLFVYETISSPIGWLTTSGAIVCAIAFVLRERTASHPLLDLSLIARPTVSSGLAYKAAAGLATAGLSYLVTIQLQLARGWSPALAAIGMLPQVLVLAASGPFVNWFIGHVGLERAAWLSTSLIVVGLAIFGLLSSFGYVWVGVALVLEAVGIRVVGVVSGVNVLNGLPKDRTSIGAALVDTSSEVTSAIGIAVTGTIIAAVFTGDITASAWSAQQAAQFDKAVIIAGITLTVVAGAIIAWAILRTRNEDSITTDLSPVHQQEDQQDCVNYGEDEGTKRLADGDPDAYDSINELYTDHDESDRHQIVRVVE